MRRFILYKSPYGSKYTVPQDYCAIILNHRKVARRKREKDKLYEELVHLKKVIEHHEEATNRKAKTTDDLEGVPGSTGTKRRRLNASAFSLDDIDHHRGLMWQIQDLEMDIDKRDLMIEGLQQQQVKYQVNWLFETGKATARTSEQEKIVEKMIDRIDAAEAMVGDKSEKIKSLSRSIELCKKELAEERTKSEGKEKQISALWRGIERLKERFAEAKSEERARSEARNKVITSQRQSIESLNKRLAEAGLSGKPSPKTYQLTAN